MYCSSSRFNLALILVVILGGCVASTPVPPPMPTLVPIATWVAQGVPEDTVIRVSGFHSGILQPGGLTGKISSITISADGTVICERIGMENFNGRISEDELKRVVMRFAEIDFFSMSDDFDSGPVGPPAFCVYYKAHPPAPSVRPTTITDQPKTIISIRIHGESKSITHDHDCEYDSRADEALENLERLIMDLVEGL